MKQVKSNLNKAAATAASLALLLALGACGARDDEADTSQQEQASVEINRQGGEGAKDAGAGVGVENPTAQMGAAPATPATPATPVEGAALDPDQKLAADVRATLAADPDFGLLKIDVHSDDGKVTLRGRAPDPSARERASEIVRAMPEVKAVDNQLTLG